MIEDSKIRNLQSEICNIKIPVFEGPLDLLLHLIKENKIEIYDIPIALITHQYLEYIEMMRELNLEIASEFLVIAATLIYIKSRMLLPPDETIETGEQEDPRAGLVQRLLEYQAYKEASDLMRQREDKWSNVFPRPPVDVDDINDAAETFQKIPMLFDVNLFDLLDALKKILSKAPPEVIRITRETLTVKDRMAIFLEKMESDNTLRFEDLFENDRTRIQIIVTFLALLEIMRLGLVRAYQDREFGTVWIMRHKEEN